MRLWLPSRCDRHARSSSWPAFLKASSAKRNGRPMTVRTGRVFDHAVFRVGRRYIARSSTGQHARRTGYFFIVIGAAITLGDGYLAWQHLTTGGELLDVLLLALGLLGVAIVMKCFVLTK